MYRTVINRLLEMLNENRKVPYFIHEEITINGLIVFSVKNKDNDFLFNILDIEGRTPKTMSVNWRSIQHIKQDLSEYITINKTNMNKLSKPKSFSVSNETLEVDFKGTICECANLLKSGIVNQTIILVGYADKWHEINALDLGADNSDLQSFKQFVEVMKLSLVDLGIVSEIAKTDYELKHDDFMELQNEFPEFNYIDISKLHEFEKTNSNTAGMYHRRQDLAFLRKNNLTINEYMEKATQEKSLRTQFKEAGNEKIVPEVITELEITEGNQLGIPVEKITSPATTIEDYIDTRMQHLTDLGLKFDVPNGTFNGFGFFITQNSISDDSEEDWNILISKITQEKSKNKITPAVVAEIIPASDNTPISTIPVKKPVSVQVFENFTPERISELVGLKEKQLEIVKANPVVKITDKTSYEKAKKTAATLLKASTAIDGKDGVDALGVRCINAFKKMFSSETGIIAKLTRDPYDEQKTIISSWENAEEIRIQAEQRAKLEKIKKRTDELFAVPFVFNGSVYSIGTVYVVGSQIENLSDEDFAVIVNNGKIIKQQLDAEAEAQKGKDAEIAALKAQLAAFMALQNMSNTDTEQPATVSENSATGAPAQPATELKTGPADQVANFMNPEHGVKPSVSYNLPAENNKLLNALDLKNAEHLEKPAYIKCRGYYVQGLIDVANEIEFILNDATPNPVKKSERIANLCVILKNSK